jgi:peptide deformylase
MIRDILTDNHPILLQKAIPVESHELPNISELIADLVDTMRSADLVGLAAPQIGISKRVFVAEVLEKNQDGEKEKQLHAFINPEFIYRSESQTTEYE